MTSLLGSPSLAYKRGAVSILDPKPWAPDHASSKCAGCTEMFTLFRRKHHCRGCGLIFCNDCMVTDRVLEQYGFMEPAPSCLPCAAPYIQVTDDKGHLPYLPTAGGDLVVPVFNAGDDATHVTVHWDDVLIPDAEFVRAKAGVRLRVPVGPGVGGGHVLKVTHKHNDNSGEKKLSAGTATISYTAPTILRVPSLRTEGGEVVIFGDNFGPEVPSSTPSSSAPSEAENNTTSSSSAPVQVLVEGIPCTNVRVKQAHKKLVCTAPPGVGIAKVTVIVGGQVSETEVLHEAPEIFSIDPPDIDVTGGLVTFTGRGFGADAERISVLLKDFAIEATNVEILEPFTSVRATFPPIPEGADIGESLGIRIIVASIHSITPCAIVYCPPSGVAATATRPAYIPRRFAPAGRGVLAVPSPYAQLFSTELQVEKKKGSSNNVLSSPSSSSSSSGSKNDSGLLSPSGGGQVGSPKTPGGGPSGHPQLKRQSSSVRVGGTLAGGGPTLSITPPTAWAPDADDCGVCKNSFGIARRRHHCRICGICVCGPCSPHQLQLAPSKPPVRVCSRCNLRVGLLNQMTAVIDSIYTIRRLLPTDMFDTFQKEVLDAVAAGSTAAAVKAAASVGLTSTPSKLSGQAFPATPNTPSIADAARRDSIDSDSENLPSSSSLSTTAAVVAPSVLAATATAPATPVAKLRAAPSSSSSSSAARSTVLAAPSPITTPSGAKTQAVASTE